MVTNMGRRFVAHTEAEMRAASNEASRRYAKKKRDAVAKIKAVPCMDCGGSFPSVCMDFDHVTGEKDFNISQELHAHGSAVLLEEIAKCEIVCANCHRIRTAARKAGTL